MVDETLRDSMSVRISEVIRVCPKPAMDFVVIQCYNSISLMPYTCLQGEASATPAERHVSNNKLFCKVADTEQCLFVWEFKSTII